MPRIRRSWVASALLVALGVASAWGPIEHSLASHQLPAQTPSTALAPSSPSTVGALPAAPAVPVPGATAPSAPGPSASAPAAPGVPGGASAPATAPAGPPPPPAPVMGVPIAETPGAPAAPSPVPAAALASAGNPYDYLLLTTGSASGLALAGRDGLDPIDAAASVGHRAVPLRLAEGFASLDLRQPQQILLEAARVAGVAAEPVRFTHDVGPGSLELAALEAYEALGIELTPEMRIELHEDAARLDPRLRDGAALLLFALADAQRSIGASLRALPPEDYQLLWVCGHPAEGSDSACPDPPRAAAVSARMDRRAIVTSALEVASAVEQVLPRLLAVRAELLRPSFAFGVVQGDPLFEDPTGLIQIGGAGDDVYRGNKLGNLSKGQLFDGAFQLLTIDLDGQERYYSRAGGTAPNPLVQAQSSGGLQLMQLGGSPIGLLSALTIDLGGDDAYGTPSLSGAQGSGNLGVGMLFDLGGNDRYTAGSFSQGSGANGVGLLVDYVGSDNYNATSRSQGYGNQPGGISILAELDGDDRYTLSMLGQGAGEAGGTGVLVDAYGNDAYTARTTGPALSQGASYRLGAKGILVDAHGADRYDISGGGHGYVQFLDAVESTGLALFLDSNGADTYTGAPANHRNNNTWQQGNLGLGMDRQ